MLTARASFPVVVVLAALVGGSGCEQKGAGTPKAAAASAALPEGFFLTGGPAGDKQVEEVKASVKPGDAVAMRGRIGGSVEPFVEGRAVFTVVGRGLLSCADNMGDACKTPWDYCCETPDDIATHSATVQVVDSAGAPLRLNLKGQNGLKEMSEVVVVGKVAQADGKVLVVNATGIYRVN